MATTTTPGDFPVDTSVDMTGLLGAILGKETNQTTQSQQNTQGTSSTNSASATNQSSQQNTVGSQQNTSQSTQNTAGSTRTTGTVSRTQDTTQQNAQTQKTTAELDPLRKAYAKQAAGVTPEMLAAIFREGSKAAPQLASSYANAVGARTDNNSAYGVALRDLQSQLVSKAADLNTKMLADSATTAGQIAANSRTVDTTASGTSSSVGQDVQDLLAATNSQTVANQISNQISQQQTNAQQTSATNASTNAVQTQQVSANENKNISTTINTGAAKGLAGLFLGGVALNEVFKAATGKGFVGNLVDFGKMLLGQGAPLAKVNAELAEAGFPPISDAEAAAIINNNNAGVPLDLPPIDYPMPDVPDAPIPDVPVYEDPVPWDFGFADGGMPSAQFLPVPQLIKKPNQAAAANPDADLDNILRSLSSGSSGGTTASGGTGTSTADNGPTESAGPGVGIGTGGIGGPGGLGGSGTAGVAGIAAAAIGVPGVPAGIVAAAVQGLLGLAATPSAGSASAVGESAAIGTDGNANGTPGATGSGDGTGEGNGGSAGVGDSSSADGGVGSADGSAYKDGGMVTNLDGDEWSAPTEATGGADDDYHTSIMTALGITRTAGGLHFNRNAMNMLHASLAGKNLKDEDAYKNGGKLQYNKGGHIQGPGTGTSDSIPATVEGQVPIRVSNNEYIIPADVVQRFGVDAFDALINKYHTPT